MFRERIGFTTKDFITWLQNNATGGVNNLRKGCTTEVRKIPVDDTDYTADRLYGRGFIEPRLIM